jgi:hypothetical protein
MPVRKEPGLNERLRLRGELPVQHLREHPFGYCELVTVARK